MATYAEQVIADGAVAYWRLNETSGTVADDAVGSADGTISGGVTLGQPSPIPGSTAMTFNGTTGQVIVATPVPIPLAATIELWVKTTDTSAQSTLFSTYLPGTGGGAGHMVFMGLQVGVIALFSVGTFLGVRTVADGQWHHVACLLTGSTATVYVDGVVDKTAAFSRTLPSSGGGASLANSGASGAEWLLGSLDEVAVYPTALTPTQIAAHYAAAATATATLPLSWASFGTTEDLMVQAYNTLRAVTPSDTVDLPALTQAIWVGGTGNVAVVTQNNVAATLTAVPAGAWLPIAARRINATNTTATAIVALYQT